MPGAPIRLIIISLLFSSQVTIEAGCTWELGWKVFKRVVSENSGEGVEWKSEWEVGSSAVKLVRNLNAYRAYILFRLDTTLFTVRLSNGRKQINMWGFSYLVTVCTYFFKPSGVNIPTVYILNDLVIIKVTGPFMYSAHTPRFRRVTELFW